MLKLRIKMTQTMIHPKITTITTVNPTSLPLRPPRRAWGILSQNLMRQNVTLPFPTWTQSGGPWFPLSRHLRPHTRVGNGQRTLCSALLGSNHYIGRSLYPSPFLLFDPVGRSRIVAQRYRADAHPATGEEASNFWGPG